MKFAKFFLMASLLTAAACAPKQQETTPSALDTIMSRKSVRTYTDQNVTDAQVETMLRAAMAAPTGMNVQPWRFVVVRDQAVKDVLAGGFNKMIAKAPVVFVVCGETTESCAVRGARRCRTRPCREPQLDCRLRRSHRESPPRRRSPWPRCRLDRLLSV